VIVLLAAAYYTHATAGLLSPTDPSAYGALFNSSAIFICLILMFLAGIAFYGMLFGSVLHYIKAYINTSGSINNQHVIEGVKKDFGNIIGLGFLSGIMVFFGLMLCFLPGVYLYVPMSLVFSILIFRDTTISEAISDSFKLIKNEWWITFATLLVLGIIISVVSAVFSVPAIIYTISKSVVMATESTLSDPSEIMDWGFIALNTIASAAKYILYVITAIASAFIYFNLNERKHATGALEQIDSLGNTD